MFEHLERRVLFAITADAFHDTLYVWGDAGGNGISVTKAGSDLVVKQYVGGGHAGYAELFRVADSEVSQIRAYGYAGADTITLGDTVTDAATVYGGRGADYLKGGGGTSNLWGHGNWPGNADHDPATDDSAADTLVSGKGYTVQRGQKGNDSHYTDTNGTSGNDIMYGGPGNDTFYVSGHGNAATAYGEAGADKFVPSQSSTQQATFNGGADWDAVNYRAWTSAVYVRPDGTTLSGLRSGTRRHVLKTDVEFVEGTDQADYFSGSEGNNTFYGWGGNDTMYGNGGNDLLVGQGGNDTIDGGNGDDTVIGSEGNDTLSGGANNDSLYGNEGNDSIHGNAGNDRLFGQEDGDWLYGDAGADVLTGGSGADYLVSHDGVFGNDRIYGDNQDGSGAGGALDVAYIDRGFIGDPVSGVESVSF